jgi:hypothetical protein
MPSLASFLLLPLVGGFLFLEICNRTRFYLRQQEGHKLYFHAAAVGGLLFTLARIITLITDYSFPASIPRRSLKLFANFDFSGAALGSLLLGVTLPWLFNFYCVNGKFLWNTSKVLLSVAEKTDELLYLLLKARSDTQQVLVTLDSGKAYVGYVLSVAHLAPELPYVKLLPTFSGFRTKDELTLELNTVYEESGILLRKFYNKTATATEEGQLLGLQIILKREKIIAASFFNSLVYKSHLEKREQKLRDKQLQEATAQSTNLEKTVRATMISVLYSYLPSDLGSERFFL